MFQLGSGPTINEAEAMSQNDYQLPNCVADDLSLNVAWASSHQIQTIAHNHEKCNSFCVEEKDMCRREPKAIF